MESFIARRLYRNEQDSRKVSRPAVVIAQAGVALGLMVMLVTIAVSFGFKHEVRAKAVGFGSHLHISNHESGQAFEANPIAVDSALTATLNGFADVEHIQRYITKPGVFRTENDFMGYVLKGWARTTTSPSSSGISRRAWCPDSRLIPYRMRSLYPAKWPTSCGSVWATV